MSGALPDGSAAALSSSSSPPPPPPQQPQLQSPRANPLVALAALSIAAARERRLSSGVSGGASSIAAGASRALDASSSSSAPASSAEDALRAHPYFPYYGLLVHQQNMLQDLVRTQCYHDAFERNAADFRDKVVVDVGTGSGILAWFAVKAGARRVYAIEASAVADRAAQLVAANGLSDRIIVLRQAVETVELPEPADVIVSEPMGFLLVHERMLESFLLARQRFLRPGGGGKVFPTTARIWTAPFQDAALHAEQAAKAAFWHSTDFFGLDLSCLAAAALADHFSQPVVGFVEAASLLAPAAAGHEVDFARDAPESLRQIDLRFDFLAAKTGVCHGLAAWFDVAFDGSTERLVLDTGPESAGTHWYQCRLLLREPVAVNAGQRLAGSLRMVGNERYSYDLTLTVGVPGSEHSTASGRPVESVVRANLHDQTYSYLTRPAAT
jgi:histone-arginine methyltransferase CARM1